MSSGARTAVLSLISALDVLRFLLGMAEAGLFPGVIYYLMLWFPARMRARAVSRFYIALPLSSTVMGCGPKFDSFDIERDKDMGREISL